MNKRIEKLAKLLNELRRKSWLETKNALSNQKMAEQLIALGYVHVDDIKPLINKSLLEKIDEDNKNK